MVHSLKFPSVIRDNYPMTSVTINLLQRRSYEFARAIRNKVLPPRFSPGTIREIAQHSSLRPTTVLVRDSELQLVLPTKVFSVCSLESSQADAAILLKAGIREFTLTSASGIDGITEVGLILRDMTGPLRGMDKVGIEVKWQQ